MALDLRPTAAVPSPLIVASHRGPFAKGADGTWRRKVNGVFAAMDPTLRSVQGTWVCWNHAEDGEPGTSRDLEVLEDGQRLYQVHELLLREEEAKAFYEGFTTEALWPILFCFPSRLAFFQRELWGTYQAINRRFAEAIAELAAPEGTVWVQDFHLMLLPGLLRKLRPDLRIGFFLHTAFPPPDVFGILPWRDELLAGVLGSDLAGFHIPLYANNFAACCARYLGADTDWSSLEAEGSPLQPRIAYERVHFQDRAVEVGSFGVGANRPEMERLASDPGIRARAEALRAQMGVEHLALSAERLDYVKGPLERLEALDLLFERHPEWRGRFTLLQIAVPTREGVEAFEQLRRQVNERVGALNGRWGTATWQPVVNLHRAHPLPELVELYLAADVCLVTPLRDGMNLVAKEYALCREDGLVVLSEFAGAAVELPEAVQVNPFDPEGVAEALHRALSMPAVDRRARFQAMKARCEARDLAWWNRAFLDRLAEVGHARA